MSILFKKDDEVLVKKEGQEAIAGVIHFTPSNTVALQYVSVWLNDAKQADYFRIDQVTLVKSALPEGYSSCMNFHKGRTVLIYGDKTVKDGEGVIYNTPPLISDNIMVKVGNVIEAVNRKSIYVSLQKEAAERNAASLKSIIIPKGFKRCVAYYPNASVEILPHDSFKIQTKGFINKYAQATATVVNVSVHGVLFDIPSEQLVIVDPLYKEPDALFTDFKKATADHKYMAELLYAPNMEETVTLGLKGVKVKDYDIYEPVKGSKYKVMVPKKAKGPMPVLMAHCDIQSNVKHPTPSNLSYDETTQKYTSPTGLGADDRAGVFVMNKVMLAHPGKFIIIFFDEEEIGCLGSNNFAQSEDFKQYIDPIASCYISIDRTRNRTTGKKHIATYGHDNAEINGLLSTKLGRPNFRGSSTDCRVLAAKSKTLSPTGEGVCCVNFSCGYQNEHTHSELLYHDELLETADDICKMVKEIPTLWSQQYTIPKTYVAPTKTKKIPTVYDDDFLLVGSRYIDTADIKALLAYYLYNTGVAYTVPNDVYIYTPALRTLVNLAEDVRGGSIYGGVLLNNAVVTKLRSKTWVVQKLNPLTSSVDLTSEDNKSTASNIPLVALVGVLTSDPRVTTL